MYDDDEKIRQDEVHIERYNKDTDQQLEAVPEQDFEEDMASDQIVQTVELQSVYDKYTLEECMEKKEHHRLEKETADYHNCIFIDGKDLSNFIINSGEIHGNIKQSVEEKKKVQGEVFHFQEKRDFREFIKLYYHTEYVPVLITLGVIKIVPVQSLMMFSDELKKKLRMENSGDESGQQPAPNTLQSVEEIALILDAESIIATIASEAGELEVRCLILKDRASIHKIAEMIWIDYPGMRQGLIDWLLIISQLKYIRKAILYQITEAIVEFCAMDFAYAKNEIIPRFTKNKNKDSLYFLEKILKRCLGIPEYQKNVDSLLCHWCKLEHKFLWLIVYRLYDKQNKYKFHEFLYRRLMQVVDEELCQGLEQQGSDVSYIYSNYSQIPFGVLQENQDMAELYVDVLAAVFGTCSTRSEKIRFGYYISGLLWQDYIEEGYPVYRSLFINCVNHKELRGKLQPLFLYIWHKKVFREILGKNVIVFYLSELEKKQRPWDYMKNFLKMLAFTGDAEDFDNTIRMLERVKNGKAGAMPAKQMIEYLMNLLTIRREKAKENR